MPSDRHLLGPQGELSEPVAEPTSMEILPWSRNHEMPAFGRAERMSPWRRALSLVDAWLCDTTDIVGRSSIRMRSRYLGVGSGDTLRTLAGGELCCVEGEDIRICALELL